MQSEFDVIVVGAGPAGCASAITLARKGVDVLIIEKAKIPGEKNMTGGVLYGSYVERYGLIDLLPNFEKEAPLQRKIVSHEVFILDEPRWDDGYCNYYRIGKDSIFSRLGFVNLDFDTGHDYSVLRRSLDRWLAEVAVREGATIQTQTAVEELLVENGKVCGVVTRNETIRSNVVIDCSGVTSDLVRQAGLRNELRPRELYHGIKKVFRLDEQKIEERFKVSKGEGRALFFFGKFMRGVSGGSFIYTNKDTLSVGTVVSMDSLIREATERFNEVGKLIDIQEELESHPMISELLDGAELVEYSAHNIPKGYKTILKKPFADGFMVAGDALGSFVKIGPMIDGMRRAIASGIMAAETYIYSSVSGSFSSRNLSRYKDLLQPVYEDVDRYGRDSFLTESSLSYRLMPSLIFASGVGVKKYEIRNRKNEQSIDAIQRIQQLTSLLNYYEDREYSHIKVNEELASRSETKPWVPLCPVNCYTLLTKKGIFASYKDLYYYNLSQLKDAKAAFEQTKKDIQEGELRFDHVACVSCGTCGAIGPRDIVLFTHEKEGHGVRYNYG